MSRAHISLHSEPSPLADVSALVGLSSLTKLDLAYTRVPDEQKAALLLHNPGHLRLLGYADRSRGKHEPPRGAERSLVY